MEKTLGTAVPKGHAMIHPSDAPGILQLKCPVFVVVRCPRKGVALQWFGVAGKAAHVLWLGGGSCSANFVPKPSDGGVASTVSLHCCLFLLQQTPCSPFESHKVSFCFCFMSLAGDWHITGTSSLFSCEKKDKCLIFNKKENSWSFFHKP